MSNDLKIICSLNFISFFIIHTYVAIIWIQSRFCEYSERRFQIALRKLRTVPGINDIKWKKFGSPQCCSNSSESWSSTTKS